MTISDNDKPTPYQFVTATKPSHFKDKSANKIVRSQATSYVRRKASLLKKASQAAVEDVSEESRRSSKTTGPRPETNYNSSPRLLDHTASDEQSHLYAQNLRSLAATSAVNDEKYAKGLRVPIPVSAPSEPSWKTQCGEQVQHGTDETLDGGRNLDTEELKMRILIRHLAKCSAHGNMPDPSDILPRFVNPQLNSIFFIRHCLRTFVTISTMEGWLPAVLNDPHLILSSTLITSGWLDMQEGIRGESVRTCMVKAEVYAMAAGHLHNPHVTLKDASILVVDNLLMGEMWDLDEDHLRMHQNRIAYLVQQRGGMQKSENKTILEISAACCFHTDLICNTDPSPIFEEWDPQDICPDPFSHFVESPFSNQNTGSSVPKPLVQLICDMRDLGDLFIGCATTMSNVDTAQHKDTTRMSSSAFELNTWTSEMIDRLINLPSASEAGHLFTDDWIYESCRIASLIYAAAIKVRISFPEAADPTRNSLYAESVRLSGGSKCTTSLSVLLFKTLERTDIENTWGDLAGVLYWVCSIGAMSARTTTMEQGASTEFDIWVRRCLSMHASRLLIMLAFQYSLPMATMAKKLLKVRQLVAPTRHRVCIPSSK
ncbi:hypothetical protein IAQ61_007992 [Plenodomus lingam]|uniref:Tachykinin family protein n=1 Tax=Leptosphaeria maculans (strain JN3 / isolate v23.1.3 / race Av1-4-5-6-7-8) TaxID=985895 RepID=E5A0K5_LEPMJ|nr:hypothetical protein LEMA_P101960.1 [Plenodomus lingam JN3]KAH9867399.1 hypothetical protein IAQ61_007992 [Plenodomus lingam]CBX97065.1 hypothetical protein LEMA_P101960.1 [Plenodomus lingam JN3]